MTPQNQTLDVGGVRYTFESKRGLFGSRQDRTGGVAIADITGSGLNDIFVVNGRHWEEDDVLLTNKGAGTVFDAQIVGPAPSTGYGACPGDVDNDGDIDVVVARDGPSPAVYVNSGRGDLSSVVEIGRPTASRDCTLTDLNGDGVLDVVFSERGGQSYALIGPLLDAPRHVDVFKGPAVSVSAGDIDGDGLVDIAFSLRGTGSIALLRQKPDGSFAAPEIFGSAEEESRAIASHDLDGDGVSEIIVAVLTGPSYILSFSGGAPAIAYTFQGVDRASAVTVSDLNNDGRSDIVFGARGRNVVALADGDGYRLEPLPGIKATTYDVATADLNGDSMPDLVFVNSGKQNEIVLSSVD
ncbi:MAG: VCBS repeat-containing protein [Pseudomonadota bacterium]